VKKAVLYKKLNQNTVQCQACAWYCRIEKGKTGVCGTRLNKNGELYSLVYSKPTGLAIDPVEKKPLHHFLPGARLLSFGTVGCNFGCQFCQNYDTTQINKGVDNPEKTVEKYSINITPREIVDLALSKKVEGIAYTYNEPAIFVEFAHDTAVLAKKKGLKNVYVSNGFESPEAFAYMKDYIDGINIDLKSNRPEFYSQICLSKIEPVRENIKRFFECGIETEVTTLIIPGHNDSTEELTRIALFLASVSKDLPWHISAFYPCYKMLDVPPTPHSTLIKAYDIGIKQGLKYVYVGNVSDPERSSTYCPGCKTILISRLNYEVTVKDLDQQTGKCKKCGEKIYGVWN
jgi:pyruvate formate lyase activating enzyme